MLWVPPGRVPWRGTTGSCGHPARTLRAAVFGSGRVLPCPRLQRVRLPPSLAITWPPRVSGPHPSQCVCGGEVGIFVLCAHSWVPWGQVLSRCTGRIWWKRLVASPPPLTCSCVCVGELGSGIAPPDGQASNPIANPATNTMGLTLNMDSDLSSPPAKEDWVPALAQVVLTPVSTQHGKKHFTSC